MKKTVVVLGTLACAWAVDWPQWRGPNRDGITSETGLMKSWPAGGPQLAWKATGLGEGYASFSVARGRLYTMGQHGNKTLVYALDAATGKKTWEAEAGGSFRERRGHGPRATPTVDGDRIYAQAADGGLVCLDAASGKRIWGYNVVNKFGAQVINWGISESPLVDGERLIVNPGGPGASIVALNKKTGELIWKSQSDEAGYSSAIVFDAGPTRHIVAFTGEGAVGLNATNGELLWRYDKISNRTANIATPIHRAGYVFLSSDYGTGCALLKLTPSGGGVKASEVYFNREMKNHYSSSVLVGDHLYGYSSAILTAMKFMTGEVLWRDRSVGKGSVIYAEGNLYCQGENGTLALVEATPEAYREKSRFSITRASEFPLWTLPVIANGRLYVRDQDVLYSFGIGAR
jgi:outer membrane protein assembly factor BamB